jgi:hypothetical protein
MTRCSLARKTGARLTERAMLGIVKRMTGSADMR